jgi:membrane associated rhomboid family serine protease
VVGPAPLALAPPDPATVQRLLVPLALVAGLAAAVAFEADLRPLADRLRRRLLLGVPWGTLVVAALVSLVYLLLQGGLASWSDPTTLPFRAWSYLYPLGLATAAFSHAGPGHLLGNLVGTLTLAPVAEYAWGHYPTERGEQSFGSLRTNPLARAFVLFPAAVAVVGLLTAAFAVGPIIGFSGVVFAFGGLAVVHYPIRTVVALSVGDLVGVVVTALRRPTTTASAEPSFSSPWWADIAVQGHALGLLLGVLLGIWLARSRGDARPGALRVFAGVLLFGSVQALWAVYWFRGESTFVLYRAVGVALLVALAAVVAAAVAASDRPLSGSGPADRSLRTTARWKVYATVVLFATAGLAGPAVVPNLVTASDEPLPGESVAVRDYEVTYAEDVTDGMVSVVDVDAFGESTAVNTSGVIVRSRERNLWVTAVSRARLSFAGRVPVRLGGVGWRDRVVAERTGWTAVGGNTTYRVTLATDDRTVTGFVAPPVRAAPVVAGRNVSVRATAEGFRLAVATDGHNATAPLPGTNETVTAGGLRFVREGRAVVAVHEPSRTRVPVATRERYRGR